MTSVDPGLTAIASPAEAFRLEFMQTALAELLLLSVAGGLLGGWIVLRRLAFYAHEPGSRRSDAAVALLLAGALATGVVLASDLLDSGAAVDRLLFGTLLGLSSGDVAFSAAAAVIAVAATLALGRAWLATGFDRPGTRAMGVRVQRLDALLLVVIAASAVAALPAVGALLVTSILIVPAATVRLVARSVPALLAGSVALAALEGSLALYAAYLLDAPPGPALAVLGAAVYALAALAVTVRR